MVSTIDTFIGMILTYYSIVLIEFVRESSLRCVKKKRDGLKLNYMG